MSSSSHGKLGIEPDQSLYCTGHVLGVGRNENASGPEPVSSVP